MHEQCRPVCSSAGDRVWGLFYTFLVTKINSSQLLVGESHHTQRGIKTPLKNQCQDFLIFPGSPHSLSNSSDININCFRLADDRGVISSIIGDSYLSLEEQHGTTMIDCINFEMGPVLLSVS